MGAKGKGKKKDEVAQAESQEILLRTFSDDPTLGLREEEAARRLEVYGKNVIKVERKVTWYATLIGAILHPFNFVLIALAVVAVATGDYRTFTVMLSMVVLSVFLRFWQETKAHSEAESLKKMVHNKARVIRRQVTNVDGIETEEAVPKDIMIEDVVVGDIVKLGAGDMIPGDIRLIQAKDLFVSQSALTGESMPVEKVSSTYLREKDGELTDGESFRPELPPLEEEPAVESIWSMFRSWFRQTILRSAGDPPKKTMRRKRKVAHRLERPDCCFLGTSVVSGTATGIVERTGANTLFGELAKELSKKKPPTSFQIGVKKVSYILISFMLIMAPIVFILNGVITKDWLQALLFSVAVAVGLVPEMLPMIVNANLARGAFVMSKKKAIVKKLESIMNFGAMDILCTDKTGTLTQDKVILLKHMSLNERESPRVVLHAYLNSTFQTGLKNLLDLAVINYVEISEESPFRSSLKSAQQPENSEGNPQFETLEEAVENFKSDYTKIDEIPFDFVRRRMSVILRNNKTGKNLLVCKGAVEELLSISRFMEDPETGEVKVFEEEKFKQAMTLGHKLNREGLRVIAVAYREVDENLEAGALKPSDEKDLVLLGFTAFLDPPKESSAPAIAELIANGITVKVLTGDNDEVCKTICEQVGLPIEGIITGKELEDRVGAAPNPLSEDSTENVVVINDDMKQKALDEITSKTTIFAKLTPLQKAEVVASLRRQGHVVGFLGDGINDSAAFLEADVGISVDSAVDVAKENADIILLEKSLMVLVKGVRLGRLTYGNTIKYIKMTASSNFGNVFSVLIASAWLPFLPMKPVHLVVQNLLYDFSQVAIPWDNMDDDFITTPKNWSANGITWFMLFMGPVSSVFDVCTFLTMWYYFGAQTPESQTLFQTAWFVEGLLTQTLIVHMIRTDKIPFIQSRPSLVLFCTTMVVMGVGVALPFTPINTFFSMTPLPAMYFPFLFAFLAGYCILSQIVKFIFIKIFKEWM